MTTEDLIKVSTLAALRPEYADAIRWASGDGAHTIAADIVRRYCQTNRISDKQLTFVASLHRDGLKRQNATPFRAGRFELQVVVLTTKQKAGRYGSYTALSLSVEEGEFRGNRIWVRQPKGVTANRGDILTIEADLEPSDRDLHFAFGSKATFKIPVEEQPSDGFDVNIQPAKA